MKVAAVDIGTNSVRLLVADRRRDGISAVQRRATVTRLGRDVDATGRLDREAVAETVDVLRRYRGAIDAEGAAVVLAVATSAVRDAQNRGDFLDRAEAALGVRPGVIEGDEEARLSFRGVTSGLQADGAILVIDPGGGSTEFVMGRRDPDYAISVNTGSVRVTERYLPEHPAPGAHVAAAAAAVDAALVEVRLPARPVSVVGVGGTFTSLAAILLDLPEHDPMRVHLSRFATSEFEEMVGRLASLTVEETAAIPSLDPARAPVLLGGAVVASRALVKAGADEVVVSEADILDGIALEIAAA